MNYSIGTVRVALAAALATAALSTLSPATAAPLHIDATGTVINGAGVWAGHVGSSFTTALDFDLDPANAYAFEIIAPSGEPPFPRWTFTGAPYGATFSGLFGTLSTGTVWLETLDNFDADAAGNPFGVTGTVDVLSINGGNVVVDCSNGTVDPVTGCSDPNAPTLSGEEFQFHLVGPDSWFSGDVLPASILPLGALVGVFGNGETFTGTTVTGSIEIVFPSFALSAVPEPGTLALFGLGLAGLGAMRRRRG